jgi:hypothetical protein
MGKSKSLRKTSKRRGGYFGLGNVINTAIVPGSLLALQQSYRKKKYSDKRSRRYRKGKKSKRRY